MYSTCCCSGIEVTLSLEDIINRASVGGRADIDIWNQLKHYLSEYWDGERHIFEQVVILSGKQLGRDGHRIQDTISYFEVLENNFSDKNDLLEFLINLTDYLNYHSEDGSIKVANKLKDLKNKLDIVRRKCLEKGIFRDKCFVGRELEMNQMIKAIETGSTKGLFVCGLGGMGKTSLTRTVCFDLRHARWRTTKIDLREQRTFFHLLQATILSIIEIRKSVSQEGKAALDNDNKDDSDMVVSEEMRLQGIFMWFLTSRINDQQIRLILVFDNIDDIEDKEEKQKMISFFIAILETIKDCKHTRIIVTCREDVLAASSPELENKMMKVEVKRMLLKDAEKLVKECTKQTNISDEDVHKVVRECGACPLAIRILCDVINDCRCEDLLFLKNKLDTILSSALNLSTVNWLVQPFMSLVQEEKELICMLSLFGTAKFDVSFADFVINGKRPKCLNEKHSSKRRNSSLQNFDSFDDHQCSCLNCKEVNNRVVELKLRLLSLKRRHFIEIDNDVFGEMKLEGNTQESEYENIYSFHPIVSKFLVIRSKDKDIKPKMDKATDNFVGLFDDIVIKIGAGYDTNVLRAFEKTKKLECFLHKYISLMEKIGDQEASHEGIVDRLNRSISIEETKQRNNVIQLILKPRHHLQFLKCISNKKFKSPLPKLEWKVEHMAACIQHDEPQKDINKLLSNLEIEINVFDTSELNDEDKIQFDILLGRIAYYKGLSLMDSSSEPRKPFEQALKLFQSDKLKHLVSCKPYQADIYNCLGCLEFKEHNPIEALKYHEKAKAIITHIKHLIYNEKVLTYQANIGACHYRIGLQNSRDQREDLKMLEFEKAIKEYDECITMAKVWKRENTFWYIKKLKNRGDVRTMLGLYDDAKKDYHESLETLRRLRPKPNELQVLIRHSQGEMIRKQTAMCKRKGWESDLESLDIDLDDMDDDGIVIYDEIKDIIDPSFFPRDHESFDKIRKNHLYFLNQSKEEDMKKEAELFYARYHSKDSESGSCVSSLSERSSVDSSETEDDNQHPTANSQIQRSHDFKPTLIKTKSDEIKRKSSSGVSSMGSSISDHNIQPSRRVSIMSGHGSSFEDDVFELRRSSDDRKEIGSDQQWKKRRVTLSSFGSRSLEKSKDGDLNKGDISRKRSIDGGLTNIYQKRQKSLEWILPDKLSEQLEDRTEEKEIQTEETQLDMLLQKEPKIQLLMDEIEAGKAKLVDDETGRPVVQYNDD